MKHIVVCVTGGIACYKSVEIVNDLTKKGYTVDVVMTKHAREFITPLTFQTLSHRKVITSLFEPIHALSTQHIQLAKKANLIIIVPATANIIGKIAGGIGDDMVTTLVMATKAPVLIAPAMNTNMWENPIVQDNIRYLKDYDYTVLETDHGHLACGDTGSGKLLPWEDIVRTAESMLT